jgi:putative acetyltransferase
MPKNPSVDQRITWHLAHSNNCGCRPIPPLIRREIRERRLLAAGGADSSAPAARTLIRATSRQSIEQARKLIKEYAASLDFDLCFQNLDKELAELPGEYSPPSGCLLLAASGKAVMGCVALRKIGDGTCEMKRLYVRPAFRGNGVGRALVEALIRDARELGYTRMLLDTDSSMRAAIRLYGSLGFEDVEPYVYNPLRGARFMGMSLK